MIFPLSKYNYTLPTDDCLGAFGVKRKYDIHTGVDLYCDHGDNVYAMESGVVIDIEDFTGEKAGSPWWNDTKAVAIKSKSGIILYGEIEPTVEKGQHVDEGHCIGTVLTVLKKDKGRTPTSMLHMEWHNDLFSGSVWWQHDTPKPDSLLDVTELLENSLP